MGFWNKAKTAERPWTWDGTEKYGPVKLASVDFCDGQQSVIATRMRTGDMLPILEQMDNFGYESIEMWGGATMRAASVAGVEAGDLYSFIMPGNGGWCDPVLKNRIENLL